MFGNLGPSTSPAGQTNGIDRWKALRAGIVTLTGTFLTVLLQVVSGTDFGAYNFLVLPIATVLTELGRRRIADYSQRHDIPQE